MAASIGRIFGICLKGIFAIIHKVAAAGHRFMGGIRIAFTKNVNNLKAIGVTPFSPTHHPEMEVKMNLSEYKEIIKQAIANEIEAHKFYKNAANTLADPHLKALFSSLADEEKKHREILTQIYSSSSIDRYFSETRDYKVAETVEAPALSLDMKPADAFALAMKKEEEAMKQYSEMADFCDDEEKRQVFLDLAAMERDHKLKMETAFTDIGYPEVW
jgi:rubrerythrin